MAIATWWTRAAALLKGQPSRQLAKATSRSGVRLVVDTNIFIAAVRSPDSSSRQLLDAVAAGRATLLISPPVFNEYRRILPQAVRSEERERILRSWIALAEPVNADRGERVVADDPDDDKFVSLALAGKADAIVSSDEHLLELAGTIDVPVLRPGQAVEMLRQDGG